MIQNHVTREEYRKMILSTKSHTKYHADKTTIDGTSFDSKKEAEHYENLRLLEKVGEISNLQRQVRFELIPSQKDANGRVLERPCTYVADFTYTDSQGNNVVEDTKGIRTKEYVIKRKLMLKIHGIRIHEV